MLPDRDTVAEAVKRVLVVEARVNVPPEALRDDEPLNGDLLRINSLAFVGLIISLEEALDAAFEDALFMNNEFRTVGDLVDVLHGEIAGAAGAA